MEKDWRRRRGMLGNQQRPAWKGKNIKLTNEPQPIYVANTRCRIDVSVWVHLCGLRRHPWAPQFSVIYSQSAQISPVVDDEDRNRPTLTRRTNGTSLGPAGAAFDPFDSNHPSFEKKCVWRGKRGKQRRNEGETTEGDTEAGPLWKQRVEKTTKTPLLLTN